MAITTLCTGKHPEAMSLEAEDHEVFDGDDDEEPTGEGTETKKRSERKRQREKQRRLDLSNALDELAAFVIQVDPEPGDADLEMKKKRKKAGEAEDSSGITRLDLIGRALKLMKRLHKENEERKRIIMTMQDRGGQPGGTENVLVMVPTLTPVDEGNYPVARAAYPAYPPVSSSYYHHGTAPPHGAPDYAMAVPSRSQPHYQPSNWGPRYAGPPPPQHHHFPPGMPQAPPNGPLPQRSPSNRHSESGHSERRPV